MTEKIRGTMERHIQTILTAFIIAVMVWVGTGVSNQGVAIAVLTIEVEQMKEQIKANPSLTRNEVIILLSPQKDAIHDLAIRMSGATKRLDKIERDLYVKYTNPNKRINN